MNMICSFLKIILISLLKRLRCEEYIASFYSPRFSKAIYALSDMGEKVDIQSIKRRLTTDPHVSD